MAAADGVQHDVSGRSWMRWTVVGLGAIWLGVVGVSVVAPDLVSGSQREHLPLAALHAWMWGLVASIALLWGMARLRGGAEHESTRRALSLAVAAIWGGAVILAAALPVYETGSDPTRLPLGAIAAPVGATLLSALAAVVARMAVDVPPGEV